MARRQTVRRTAIGFERTGNSLSERRDDWRGVLSRECWRGLRFEQRVRARHGCGLLLYSKLSCRFCLVC